MTARFRSAFAPASVGLAWCLLTACAFPKAAPPPAMVSAADVAAARARWPDASEASLQKGREVFVAKCGACHKHPDVTSVPEERWPQIMSKMAKKADLDAEQEQAALRFVLTARARASSRESP